MSAVSHTVLVTPIRFIDASRSASQARADGGRRMSGTSGLTRPSGRSAAITFHTLRCGELALQPGNLLGAEQWRRSRPAVGPR